MQRKLMPAKDALTEYLIPTAKPCSRPPAFRGPVVGADAVRRLTRCGLLVGGR